MMYIIAIKIKASKESLN